MYEGDYVYEQKEGEGNYFFESGESYKGQWKGDLQNGKGKLYYKNGNLMYEGDFVNDQREGNGKFIFENGKY